MNQKAANKKINELVKEASAKLAEAEKLADEYGVDFAFSPAYGMGGHYYPNPANVEKWEGSPEDYDFVEKDDSGEYVHACDYNNIAEGDEGFWSASSSGC